MAIKKYFFPLDSSEKEKLQNKLRTVTPMICVCSSFAAILQSDGTVHIQTLSLTKQICQDAIKIVPGSDHLLCLHRDGTVSSIGDNSKGQGDVTQWNNIQDIAAGPFCSIAMTKDEKLLIAGVFEKEANLSLDDFESVRLLEEPFSANNYCGITSNKNNLSFVPGTVPIVFSAPYSVSYFRNGKNRVSHCYTGGFVRHIQKRFDTFSAVRTYNDGDDPNSLSATNVKFRNKLSAFITNYSAQCLISVYVSYDPEGPDISVGDGSGRNSHERTNFLPVFRECLIQSKFTFKINNNIDKAYNPMSNEIHRRTNISCYNMIIKDELFHSPKGMDQLMDFVKLFIEKSEEKFFNSKTIKI